ncbi:MAG: amidohydrolase, partial [Acholeplasmatales bacterium]|nr:amidohydrolase [Acholeplasmatales bacterium]
MINKIKALSDDYETELIKIRRLLHMIPECGFDVEKTSGIVFNKLIEYGYNPKRCGKAGVIAEVGKGDKCILLRADMDALNIKEEANLSYKSTNGNMHACGHDMHTAMLLGAARILKKIEEDLMFRVRLMFQPAEEILEGCKDMIINNVLDDVLCAVMIHISSGTNLKSGSIIIPNAGVAAPSCDYFEINIIGSGSHSGMVELGNNPIIPSVKIIDELCNIKDDVILTVSAVNAGEIANVVPSLATIKGTMRCYNEYKRINTKIKINDIVSKVAKKYNVEGNIRYTNSCPSLLIDSKLNKDVSDIFKKHLNDNIVDVSNLNTKSSGSEDFAYVSNHIPTILLSLSAGSIDEGYLYPLHYPKVM